jgi:hypothetical protein
MGASMHLQTPRRFETKSYGSHWISSSYMQGFQTFREYFKFVKSFPVGFVARRKIFKKRGTNQQLFSWWLYIQRCAHLFCVESRKPHCFFKRFLEHFPIKIEMKKLLWLKHSQMEVVE